MKLPIKHKYFEQIKSGKKDIEYRDAHITFIDEKTGETLRKGIATVGFCKKEDLPRGIPKRLFEDEWILKIKIMDDYGKKKELKK